MKTTATNNLTATSNTNPLFTLLFGANSRSEKKYFIPFKTKTNYPSLKSKNKLSDSENKFLAEKSKQALSTNILTFNPYLVIGKERFLNVIKEHFDLKGSKLKQLELMAFLCRLKGFGWATNKYIAKKIKYHRNTVSRNLDYFVKNTLIKKCTVTLKGKKHKGFKFVWQKYFYDYGVKNKPQAVQNFVGVNGAKFSNSVQESVHRGSYCAQHQHAENIKENTIKTAPKTKRTFKEPNKRTTTKNKVSNPMPKPGKHAKSSSFSFGINSLKTLSKNDKIIKYWEDQGLTNWHINSWTKEITHNVEKTEEYLIYAYHDFVTGKKKVNNPLGYLYKTMERTGTYAKPPICKNQEEMQVKKQKQLESERLALAKEKAKQAKIVQEQAKVLAFEEKYGAEFEAMMNNPESELCKKCLKAAPNDFSRNILRKNLRKGPLPLGSPWRVTLRQTFLEVKEHVTEEWREKNGNIR